MDGATKAAIVLLAAERSQSIELLKLLEPDEVRSISQGAERLGPINATLLASVIASFEDNYSDGLKFLGSAAEVRQLITEAVGGETVTAAMAGAPQKRVHESPWPALGSLPVDELRAYVVTQHPQVAAFILSRLDAERNAELLEQIDLDVCSDLMARMLAISDPPDVIVAAIEEVLAKDLTRPTSSSSGQMHAGLASVINRLDRARAADLMDRLQAQRPADAKLVERLLFRFEDLQKLPIAALTTVVEAVPVEQLVLALNGADPVLQSTVLGVMSARTKRMAESELQNGATVNQRTLLFARQFVVETVLRLVASGTIELSAGPSGEQNFGR